MPSEAQARITIDKLLEAAGWRFAPDARGRAANGVCEHRITRATFAPGQELVPLTSGDLRAAAEPVHGCLSRTALGTPDAGLLAVCRGHREYPLLTVNQAMLKAAACLSTPTEAL